MNVDWAGVRAHVDGAIAAIEPHDSRERFEGMGVEVIASAAKFAGRDCIEVQGRTLRAPRIVIATGSRPAVPAIEGLADVPYLTNETLFELDELPRHLLILGGGPVGMEMAQAFRRLGSDVTVIDRGAPLSRDDDDAASLVAGRLEREGVRFELSIEAEHVRRSDGNIAITLTDGRAMEGSHLLVALGRQPNIGDLDLAKAGIHHSSQGIRVDGRRRTSNRRVYAIGDCRSGPRFTHAAGHEGSLVAVEVALGLPSKADWTALPHVTFTDPELAQVGLTEAQARQRHGDKVMVVREDFSHNDRAIAEGDADGFLKLVMKGRKLLGVTIVGAHAGDLLLPWTQIMTRTNSTFALVSAILAYPTRSEISKAAAFTAWEGFIFGKWLRRWAKLTAKGRRWFA
jgi:pyruvate/2-oxoglutarate dehydrogenase complex dihydrolipoamide dehydrogenase (E3) component